MVHRRVLVCLPHTACPDKDTAFHAIDTALEPFGEGFPVAPYRLDLPDDPADWHLLPELHEQTPLPADLTWEAVADAQRTIPHRIPADQRVHLDTTGRAFVMSTGNPQGHWEGWTLGGRGHPFLHLHPERPPDTLQLSACPASACPLGPHPDRADAAVAAHIDWAATQHAHTDRAEGAFASCELLTLDGTWLACRTGSSPQRQRHHAALAAYLTGLAGEVFVAAVDCHA
ncbi:hypothetical protein [Phytomonospora endophytica]|uniref:Uncharacterized protein n=1 Tax=Phytomonospora endophytica TaxID=714109 RepID=A0A841G337_9ACTN|nr:hypothetical protein [Phytomonospora endophytica]MBB6038530.1 hypothetical protein [Phytomonospora endophytica]GIG69330.1 hypothetical protein Pen01_56250 [Phytomonospora endophytica]